MTDRTKTIDVPALAGNTGNWAVSTTDRYDIKRSLVHGARWIAEESGHTSLALMLTPTQATEISMSQEAIVYMKAGWLELARLKGDPDAELICGLPRVFYVARIEISPDIDVPTLVAPTAANPMWKVRYINAI